MAPLDRRASHGAAFELVIQDDALVVLHAQQPRCLLLPRGRVDASSPLALTTDDARDFRSVHGRRMGFDAIYGIFHLLRGPYLALVTQSRVVGRGVDDKEIRRVEKLELMLIPTQQLPLLTPVQEEDEATYMDMLTRDIETQQLHFSMDYDLTHSLQRIAGFDPKTRSNSRAIAERADRRFCWNYGLCQPFIDQKLWEWITPMMQAHVEVADRLAVRDASFKIVYISRRSARRQGCRFTMRGIDADGNVANFVETEQICLLTDGRQTSFVQIRGSIPVYWSSPVTMKYAPTVYQRNVLSHDVAAFQRHADELRTLYGRVVMVNLIDKKREQLRLGEAFAKTVAQAATQDKHVLANVRLVWFDFHHECRGMQWQHLAKLIQQVDDDFQGHGFFSRGADGTVLATQSGVVRTNCMDNLDRTNVVQSLFARRSVLLQLGETDALQGDVLSSPFDAFETVFKNVWGNNADAISLFYAGTGALKTDFTRTGKRTKMGALMDGYNSCLRYFLNNFRDGYRQDVVDLLLGKYVVSRSKPSPFRQSDSDRETLESFLVKVVGVVGVFFFIESVRSGLAFVFHNLFKATLWTLLVSGAVLGQQLKKGTALGQRLVQPPRFRPQDGCMVAWKK